MVRAAAPIVFVTLVLASCVRLGERTSVAGLAAETVFVGMCDASGAVPVSERLFVIADDEDNVLRLYDAEKGGPPIAQSDISRPVNLIKEKKAKKKDGKKQPPKTKTRTLEADLEAATRLGDLAFWITSHGRNKKGKEKGERMRFFATTVPAPGQEPAVVGEPYSLLLDDLIREPRLAPFDLAAAAERPPTETGALNIEGMTARPEGGVLLGFRNPIPHGRALLVPLLNPEEVVHGARAAFGDPIMLDLDGGGVRSLTWWRGRYYIAAGPHDGRGRSRLYAWSGDGSPEEVASVAFEHFNPEAFFTPEEREEFMVFSDDGSSEVDGAPCKELRDPGRRSFRGVWVKPAAARDPAP